MNLKDKIMLVVFLTSVFLLNINTARGEATELSVEELETVAQSMRAVEDALLNVRIDSNSWVEEGPSSSGPWERTPVCWSTTAYYGKISSNQARIDVHKSVLPWENGAAPYLQKSYSVSFDGEQVRRKEISSSFSGKTFDIDTAVIFPKASALAQLRGFGRITGVEASLFFHYCGMPEPLPERFSANFEAIADPNYFLSALATADPNYSNIKPLAAKVVLEELRGIQCIKMVVMADSAPTAWWLDPNRGFALLRIENWRVDQDGNERLKSSINVTKLEEVAENIWWPMEMSTVSKSHEAGKPWRRFVYRASNVVANDPNFDDSIFTVPFPEGYRISDEVTGRTYIVGQDPNNPDE
jgi:hypothetical protein